ncbi:hypothetical protein J8J20_23995, partial [Mycobacterium tuberculosis]|nr:hypothetical protein [Mycobacterium tuberculosis]
MHVYASPGYIAKYGKIENIDEIDSHRIVSFGEPAPSYLTNLNWLEGIGRSDGNLRPAVLQINNLLSIKRAIQKGVGLGVLPDY